MWGTAFSSNAWDPFCTPGTCAQLQTTTYSSFCAGYGRRATCLSPNRAHIERDRSCTIEMCCRSSSSLSTADGVWVSGCCGSGSWVGGFAGSIVERGGFIVGKSLRLLALVGFDLHSHSLSTNCLLFAFYIYTLFVRLIN